MRVNWYKKDPFCAPRKREGTVLYALATNPPSFVVAMDDLSFDCVAITECTRVEDIL